MNFHNRLLFCYEFDFWWWNFPVDTLVVSVRIRRRSLLTSNIFSIRRLIHALKRQCHEIFDICNFHQTASSSPIRGLECFFSFSHFLWSYSNSKSTPKSIRRSQNLMLVDSTYTCGLFFMDCC